MRQMMVAAGVTMALAIPGAAQEWVAVPPMAHASGERLQTEVARATVESRVTRGAPYSGEAVTEITQVLADGNRISRKSTTRIYRDADGRTRRENISANGDVTSINISDPVGESTYVLYPETKIAHRNGVIMVSPSGRGSASARVEPGSGGVVVATRSPDGSPSVYAGDPNAAGGAGTGGARAGGRGAASAGGGGTGGGVALPVPLPASTAPTRMRLGPGETKKEELGQQLIEGVMATGTRTTTTIAAGTIGNAKPIQIVAEQWVSDDLKVLVMTRHSDPRSGETSYRLTNIIQGEPPRSLFEVPADYTLKDSVIRRQSPMQP
jgi:hypothetical protein